MNVVVLWIIAAMVAVIGLVQVLQGQFIFGVVLMIAAAMVGPGGYTVFNRR